MLHLVRTVFLRLGLGRIEALLIFAVLHNVGRLGARCKPIAGLRGRFTRHLAAALSSRTSGVAI